MNAVYLKDQKFRANGQMLKKFREQLNLPLNKMGKFFIKHGVKKLGDKSYVEMEKERRKFEKKKFEDVAWAFAQEAANQRVDFLISVQELYHEEQKRNKFHFFLQRIDQAENLFKFLDRADKKKTLNLSYINSEHEVYIKRLFKKISDYLDNSFFASNNSNSESEEELGDFTKESTVIENLISVDKCLSAIKIGQAPLGIFCGILPVDNLELHVNDIPWTAGFISQGDGYESGDWHQKQYVKSAVKKVQFKIENRKYLIIYFGDPKYSFMKAVYNMPFTKHELNNIVSKQDKLPNNFDQMPEKIGADILKAHAMAELILKTGKIEPNILLKTNFEITPLYVNEEKK